jgi:CRISPR-associated endonuclease/helicase Cas3
VPDLAVEDFEAFFCEAFAEDPAAGTCTGPGHPGHVAPYPWQQALLDSVCGGSWPEQIAVPTAAGKTAVIEVHTFTCALAAAGALTGPVPRRLALVVDRRALVDDQGPHAQRLADRLARAEAADDGSALARAARALRTWRWQGTGPGTRTPLLVARLRGGALPDREWLHDPVAASVLCCTPDMFGSRLLFRGYGSSRAARPREAGLLGHDTVVVIDEAHLNRQLLRTARRVRDLQLQVPGGTPTLALQVVETTATPTGAVRSVVALDPDDLGSEELARRMTAPKPVQLLPLEGWAFRKSPSATASFIDAAVQLRHEYGPTVAVYVNTVASAVQAAAALRTRTVGGRQLRVEVLCGRLRRWDFDRILADHPGLLTGTGADASVDVVVATQTLEVGVDADFSAAISELAPASALAQRAGRVNRRGRRSGTCFTVAMPAEVGADAPPYVGADLTAAQTWLRRRAEDPRGLAAATIAEDIPPPTHLRRPHLQRLELAETWQFARTSDDLAADAQPGLWIEDDLEADSSVGVVVRSRLPVDGIDAARLVRDLGIDAREVFPVAVSAAAAIVQGILDRPGLDPRPAAVRAPNGDPSQAQPMSTPPDLRPGDVVVIDAATEVQVHNVVLPPGTKGRTAATDVLHELPGRLRYRLEPDAGPGGDREAAALLEAAEALADGAGRRQRDSAAGVLAQLGSPAAQQAAALLRQRLSACDIAVHLDPGGQPIRLVVVQRAENTGADRQERSADAAPISLQQHGDAVHDRAEGLAAVLLVDPVLKAAVRLGGLYHDLGKQDPRFQVRLGATPDSGPLAKSGARAASAPDGSGLPAGWRHEQLSAVLAAERSPDFQCAEPGRDALAVRLAGTSHGHGRPGFRHGVDDLLGDGEDDGDGVREMALRLFGLGLWDELVEATERHWGVWGCAYLEALLRASDAQVSAEGS